MSNQKFVAAKIQTIFGICNKKAKIIFDVALQCCNKEYNNRKCRRIINSIYHNVIRVLYPTSYRWWWKVLIATLQHATTSVQNAPKRMKCKYFYK